MNLFELILRLFKHKKMNTNFNIYDYKNELVNYLKSVEGGLSNDPKDINAAKFPSPTPEKYHTNKGVTYKIFVDNASKLGYLSSVDNFLKMPDSIWLKIKNELYLNKGKKFTNNPILSDYVGLWFWGGWANSFLPKTNVESVLKSDLSDKRKLRKLVDLRKLYFQNLTLKRPELNRYLNGWRKRADKFYTTFSKYLS